MSYSSTFTANGLRSQLNVEFIGGSYTLDIAIQDEKGKRKQFVRIPLNDFAMSDLCMFTAFINAHIQSMDPEDHAMMCELDPCPDWMNDMEEMDEDDDMYDDEEEV